MGEETHARAVRCNKQTSQPLGNTFSFFLSLAAEAKHQRKEDLKHTRKSSLFLQYREHDGSFCLFSVKFSNDSKYVIGGGNDACLYVYDLDREERILKVKGRRVLFAFNSLLLEISLEVLSRVKRKWEFGWE